MFYSTIPPPSPPGPSSRTPSMVPPPGRQPQGNVPPIPMPPRPDMMMIRQPVPQGNIISYRNILCAVVLPLWFDIHILLLFIPVISTLGSVHGKVDQKNSQNEIVFDRLWYPLSILLLAAIGAKLIGPHVGLQVD